MLFVVMLGPLATVDMNIARPALAHDDEQQIKSHADPLDAILLESAEQAEGPYEPVKHWSLVTQPLGLKVSQTQQTQFYRIKAPTPLKLLAPIDMDTYMILPFEG